MMTRKSYIIWNEMSIKTQQEVKENAGKYMQEVRNYARTTRGRRYKML